MHPKSSNKNKFIGLINSILPLFFLMLILMTILEVLKLFFYRGTDGWGMHIVNVLFTSLIAAIGTYLILKKNRSDINKTKVEFKKDEKKKNYEESFFNHSTLEAIINSTADGILVVDRNGKITKSNKKFAEIDRKSVV